MIMKAQTRILTLGGRRVEGQNGKRGQVKYNTEVANFQKLGGIYYYRNNRETRTKPSIG